MDVDVDELLQVEQQEEQERLEQEIGRLDELQDERAEIHSENISELESKLKWYVDRLERGYKQVWSRERLSCLKTKIEDLYSELRRERRIQWKDRLELELELVEVQRALQESKAEDRVLEFFESFESP